MKQSTACQALTNYELTMNHLSTINQLWTNHESTVDRVWSHGWFIWSVVGSTMNLSTVTMIRSEDHWGQPDDSRMCLAMTPQLTIEKTRCRGNITTNHRSIGSHVEWSLGWLMGKTWESRLLYPPIVAGVPCRFPNHGWDDSLHQWLAIVDAGSSAIQLTIKELPNSHRPFLKIGDSQFSILS